MTTDRDKKDRLRRGYILLEATSKELASRSIDLATELEDDYPQAEALFADLVDLTLEEVVSRTKWRPSRSWLTILLEQRIRRDAIARNKKRKATIRSQKLKAAAEARVKAKRDGARDVGRPAVEGLPQEPCSDT